MCVLISTSRFVRLAVFESCCDNVFLDKVRNQTIWANRNTQFCIFKTFFAKKSQSLAISVKFFNY